MKAVMRLMVHRRVSRCRPISTVRLDCIMALLLSKSRCNPGSLGSERRVPLCFFGTLASACGKLACTAATRMTDRTKRPMHAAATWAASLGLVVDSATSPLVDSWSCRCSVSNKCGSTDEQECSTTLVKASTLLSIFEHQDTKTFRI